MDFQYHINLNNDYEFRYYCTQESIRALEGAVTLQSFPSRSTIFIILISDLASATPYLAKKMVDLSIQLFRLMNVKDEDLETMDWSASDLTGVLIFQLINPAACTGIRIIAAIAGLIIPSLALKGWKLAEHGESLSLLLWVNLFRDVDNQSSEKQAREEIYPAHAIYYLGETQTRVALGRDSIDYQNIEDQILIDFEMLLRIIALDDRECFNTLLDYHKTTESRAKISKKGTSYRFGYKAMQILNNLKSISQDETSDTEDVIDWLTEELTIEELHRLFNHININIRKTLLEEDSNLNKTVIEEYLSDLKDLFSQRLRFGRAHYPQSFYNIYCTGSD